jgi:hypothetical protein
MASGYDLDPELRNGTVLVLRHSARGSLKDIRIYDSSGLELSVFSGKEIERHPSELIVLFRRAIDIDEQGDEEEEDED